MTSDPAGGCPSGGAYYDPAEIPGSNGFNTYVNNNVTDGIPGATQTLTSYSPSNWSILASMPAGNTSVVSYPDVQQLYTLTTNQPDPLAGFTSLGSSFIESMPPGSGTIAEAAYDLWTNYTSDIMIWTDNVGRCNAGAQGTQIGTAVIGGQGFTVYRYGAPGGEIIFSLDGPGGTGTCANEASGTVDILGVLDWVNANVAPVTGLGQIQFGWEICSTGSVPETFTVSHYSISETP